MQHLFSKKLIAYLEHFAGHLPLSGNPTQDTYAEEHFKCAHWKMLGFRVRIGLSENQIGISRNLGEGTVCITKGRGPQPGGKLK